MALPPPPTKSDSGSFMWVDWYNKLTAYLNNGNSIPWGVVSKAGSALSDLASRAHVQLTSVQGGNATEQYHLTAAQYAALGTTYVNTFNTRSGAVTLTSADVIAALTFTPAPVASPTFTGVVTSPKFITATGSASAATGVATITYTLPNSAVSMYLVSANAGNNNDTIYSAFAVIAADGPSARIALSNNGANLSITLVGLDIKVTQVSGVTLTVNVTVTKIG